MGERVITLGTANILFGGVELKKKHESVDVLDWLLLHAMVLWVKSEKFISTRLLDGNSDAIKTIVQLHHPDVLVINEVMPDISQAPLQQLERLGYHVSIGRAEHKPYPLATATVVASKHALRELPFSLPGKSGGGSRAVEISELELIVVAPQPSAFNSRIRASQLAYTANQARAFNRLEPGYELIIMGDLNSDGKEVDGYFESLGLKRYSQPTFPSQSLLNGLRKERWNLLRRIMQLNKGSRDLDQIHVPAKWKNDSFQTLEMGSDHEAVIGVFKR